MNDQQQQDLLNSLSTAEDALTRAMQQLDNAYSVVSSLAAALRASYQQCRQLLELEQELSGPPEELADDTSASASDSADDEVLIRIPLWLVEKDDWPSATMRGRVLEERGKGLLFAGHAAVMESDNCLRCGREITHPGSRWCGYGPVCAERLGIERPGVVTEAQARELVRRAVEVRTSKQGWLPKSRVEVVA
jgi:hypothetical protein